MGRKKSKFKADCGKCAYGASGGSGTICCCYYGSEDCEPYGNCSQFAPECECYQCNETHKIENMRHWSHGWLCKKCYKEDE